ncbi:MAG: AsmA-like C-terminal region-containing protein [Cytophagaceae bacterium]
MLYTLLSITLLLSTGIALTYIFEDKIIALTLKELNKYLNVKIEVDPKIELSILDKFPQVSLKFKNVRIHESVEDSKERMGTLEELYFSFDVYDFIQGKYVINHISIANGSLHLKTDKDGRINYAVLKEDSSGSSGTVSFHLRKIDIQNVDVIYDNRQNDQYYSVLARSSNATLKLQEKILAISLHGKLLVHSIQIHKLEYFANKDVVISFQQEYDQTKELMTFLPSELKIQNSSYSVSGSLLLKDKKYMDLAVTGKNTSIANLLSLLPSQISADLTVYKGTGAVYFSSQIKGFISDTENPFINIDFGFKDASFCHPRFNEKITRAELKGNFNNGKTHNLSGSSLSLSNISGVFASQPFKGSFALRNFNDPVINLQFAGDVNIETLLKFYPAEAVKSAKGMIGLDISFSGKAGDLRTHEGKKKIETSGQISLRDVNLVFKNQDLPFNNLNGKFAFNRNDLDIQEFTGMVGKSDFRVKGTMKNFFSKVIYQKEKLIVDASLESTQLNLNELLGVDEKSAKDTASANSYVSVLREYLFRLDFKVRNLHFHKLHAKDIEGKLKLEMPLIQLSFSSFKAAGGKMQLSSFIHYKSSEKIEVNAKAELSQINIDSIFFITGNFNQSFLTWENIKGEFSGNIKAILTLNQNLDIDPASVIASIDASIKKGQLINFGPMRKLSRFIDEKELADIRFSELKNNIYIEGQTINIPEMVIKSNISDISVSGTHTFDQHIDYKLTVPLKNIRQKFKDNEEASAAIEDNILGKACIYLTIKGTTDDYKISYDSRRTRGKIKDDLKKEKKELQDLFKKKEAEQEKTQQLNEEEFIDVD